MTGPYSQAICTHALALKSIHFEGFQFQTSGIVWALVWPDSIAGSLLTSVYLLSLESIAEIANEPTSWPDAAGMETEMQAEQPSLELSMLLSHFHLWSLCPQYVEKAHLHHLLPPCHCYASQAAQHSTVSSLFPGFWLQFLSAIPWFVEETANHLERFSTYLLASKSIPLSAMLPSLSHAYSDLSHADKR